MGIVVKINDSAFNNIYDSVSGFLISESGSNTKKAKMYIDACHEKFKMKQNLSLIESSFIFYLDSEPNRTYKIDLFLAPQFENKVDFIGWAKNEISRVIEILK
ncbi:hypothetical protein RFI02_02130 [Acinetobacter sichuanensis]|uniref:hypothetical protein n=1 Tax=Acinetobacter sichuanensis TaxID=2136183 RepID=UPI00280C8BE4|nr:hypothetical protein [Acinetobacter sichuanensis]MDQ9019898.1 hypothetical protein [Acinetobacter sichuanensis]